MQSPSNLSALLTAAVDALPHGFWLVDADWRVLYTNTWAARQAGSTAAALTGADFWALHNGPLDPEQGPACRLALSEGTTLNLKTRDQRTGGSLEVTVSPAAEGASIVVRELSSPAAREPENRYQALFDSMQEGVLLSEIVEDGTNGPIDFRYLDMNPAAEKILGIPHTSVVGKTAREILPVVREDLLQLFADLVRTGDPVRFETYEPLVDQFHESVGFRPAPGQAAVVFWDVTERKRTEQAVARERRRLDIALRAGQMGVYEWRVGSAEIWWSPEIFSVYGVDPDTFVPTVEGFVSLVHPDDRDELWRKTEESIARRELFHYEYRIVRPDGEVCWIANQSQVIVDPDGTARITGVATDVTDRRKADDAIRQSEVRLRIAIEAAGMFAWVTDAVAGTIEWTENAATVIGCQPEDLSRDRAQALFFVHEEDVDRVMQRFRTAVDRGETSYDVGFRGKTYGSVERWFHAHGVIEYDQGGNPIRLYGVTQDVTDGRANEMQRERHLAEIEELNARLQRAMAETHHRVKNNLQVVWALIDLQVMSGEPAIPMAEVERIGQHVRSLAAIHELLTVRSKSDAASDSVLSHEVIGKLAPLLKSVVRDREIRYNVEEITLASRHSTSLAVLINELVSNAAKHGDGDIEVTLAVVEDRARLSVSDQGLGFPTPFDASRAKNTGLELVESVGRHELMGRVDYNNRPEGGANVVVEFPLPKPANGRSV